MTSEVIDFAVSFAETAFVTNVINRRELIAQLSLGILTLSGGLPLLAATSKDAAEAKAFDASRRYVGTRFGRIAYADLGSGDAALFLHGFPLSSFQWRGAIERLSPYKRCIAPDFLGMGLTEVANGGDVSPNAQVEMLVEMIDKLSIQTVDIIASDSGGAVAQLFLTRHGQRVRSLLLTNCDTEPDSPPAALKPVIEMSHAGTYVDQWLVPWLADKALARSAKGIGGMCYVDHGHPTDYAIDRYFGPLVSSRDRKALVHAFVLGMERNPLMGIGSLLRESEVPVSIVWGMSDTIFSSSSPAYLQATVGNCRGVRRLSGRKLFWPEELPGVVAEEALKLWRSSSAQDSTLSLSGIPMAHDRSVSMRWTTPRRRHGNASACLKRKSHFRHGLFSCQSISSGTMWERSSSPQAFSRTRPRFSLGSGLCHI